MSKNNMLKDMTSPEILRALKKVGADLRLARTMRGLSISMVADEIGTGRIAVMNAEKGNPGTAVIIYVALAEYFGRLHAFNDFVDPTGDREMMALELAGRYKPARKKPVVLIAQNN